MEFCRAQLESKHRSVCLLLSKRPKASTINFLDMWRSAGGVGKVLLVDTDPSWQRISKLHHSVRFTSFAMLSEQYGEASMSCNIGACIITDPVRLPPVALVNIANSLRAGGFLVLLLPSRPTWEELLCLGQTSPTDSINLLYKRILLRLNDCQAWVLLDDRMQIISQSQGMILQSQDHSSRHGQEDDMNLPKVKETLASTPTIGPLITLAQTTDQSRIVLSFFQFASERCMVGTIAVNGPRRRGKTAALGLCVAGAISYGYSNIFVTAETPLAAQSLFSALLHGLDALGYREQQDYHLIQSSQVEGSGPLLMRINIFREYRQTVQYIYPSDSDKADQAEVLVIRDATSLDPEEFQQLLRPCLLLVSSTVSGPNSAGPAATNHVLEELRTRSMQGPSQLAANAAAEIRGADRRKGERQVHEDRWRKAAAAVSKSRSTCSFIDIYASTPLHWAARDPLEHWVDNILGLGKERFGLKHGTPAPSACELYCLDSQAMLSGHRLTEKLLERVLYICGAWDRKRRADRLEKLMERGSHVFVLLAEEATEQDTEEGLPDILGLLHLRVDEGGGHEDVEGEQTDFSDGPLQPEIEIVHIAVHPDIRRMGYGSRMLDLLRRYMRGEMGIGQDTIADGVQDAIGEPDEVQTPLWEAPRPQTVTRPALWTLEERGQLWTRRMQEQPETIVVQGVRVTPEWSLNFWRKAGYMPVGLEGHKEDLRVRMVLALTRHGGTHRAREFQARMLRLLPSKYRELGTMTALRLLAIQGAERAEESSTPPMAGHLSDTTSRHAWYLASSPTLSMEEQSFLLSDHDMQRLEMYTRSLVDRALVSDLLPLLSQLYFQRRLPGPPAMPDLQAAILLGLGLQHKALEYLSHELRLPAQQVLALFNRAVRRITCTLHAMQEAEMKAEMQMASAAARSRSAAAQQKSLDAHEQLEQQVKPGALAALQQSQAAELQKLDVLRYSVKGTTEEWEAALQGDAKTALDGGLLQISSRRGAGTERGPPKRTFLEKVLDVDSGDNSKRRKGDKYAERHYNIIKARKKQ